jgi:hypothetical protein
MLTIETPFLDTTDPAFARPLPKAVARARADVLEAAAILLGIQEPDLVKPWPWKGDSHAEVRYGAYRAAEALELAEIEARTLMAAGDSSETDTGRRIGPATAARWDLHGLLLPLEEGDVDADPGGGEWPIRTVLGHAIASQYGYAMGSAWWDAQGYRLDDATLPAHIPDGIIEWLEDDGPQSLGSLAGVRGRLDSYLDLTAERLAGMPDERSARAARWSGFAVPIAFRFGRMASHLREHTIQVEKTLVMLGRERPEPARLVRNVLAAYGRAESTAFGRRNTDAAAQRIAQGAAEALESLRSARASAEA